MIQISPACFLLQQLLSHSRPYFPSYFLPAARSFQLKHLKNTPAHLNSFSLPSTWHFWSIFMKWFNWSLATWGFCTDLLQQNYFVGNDPFTPSRKLTSVDPLLSIQLTNCPGGTHTTSTAPPPPSAGGFLKTGDPAIAGTHPQEIFPTLKVKAYCCNIQYRWQKYFRSITVHANISYLLVVEIYSDGTLLMLLYTDLREPFKYYFADFVRKGEGGNP